MSRSTSEQREKEFARKGSLSEETLNSIKNDLKRRMEIVDREYTNKERQARIDASKVVLNA